MSGTTHIVFGDAGAIELRDALRQLERDDRVLEFPDNLSFGPIAPSDPATRAQWVADELDAPDWRAIVPQVEAFWTAALAGDARHIVWFSRRVTRDYTGFLDYLWWIGDRPCDVVDLTETMVPVRGSDGAVRGSRRAICTGLLDAYQFLDANLFAQATPLADDIRRRYRTQWEELRAENAALRVVTPELRLVSAPLNQFDDALLKQMQHRFLKAARVIGHAMMEQWDRDIIDVDDFFLSRRLLMLARAGVIESQGDLRHIRFSEVRVRP
jgi:uncharacterized protein DUF3658/uncharacterized protein DUF1835